VICGLLAIVVAAGFAGAAMQATLAIVGGVLGGLAWWKTGHWSWLAGVNSEH
jgi:hypothetical protein